MLSSSRAKIHEPLVTDVSPRPHGPSRRQENRETRGHHRPPNRIGADLRRRRRRPGRPPPRPAGQPAPARTLGPLRHTPQAHRGRQRRHRPWAGRLVLVTGRPRL